MNYTTKCGQAQASILEELAKLESVVLTPKQAAPALGCNPYFINLMAKDEKKRSLLGFPVVMVGSRVKIPRIPFLKFLGWQGQLTEVAE